MKNKAIAIIVVFSVLLCACDRVPFDEGHAIKNDTLAALIMGGAVYCKGTHDIDLARVECILFYSNRVDMVTAVGGLKALGWKCFGNEAAIDTTDVIVLRRSKRIPCYFSQSYEELILRLQNDGYVRVVYH